MVNNNVYFRFIIILDNMSTCNIHRKYTKKNEKITKNTIKA